MYKKKFGRMTVGAWLNWEMEQTKPFLMLFVGAMLTGVGFLVRFSVGSPYERMPMLALCEHLPPLWLLGLLWSAALFTVGCAGGFVLGYRERGIAAEKYKGGMLFLLLSALELLWYAVFFGGGLLFASALLAVGILCASVVTTVCFARVSKFAGMILAFHDVWLAYMVVLNFLVLFSC